MAAPTRASTSKLLERTSRQLRGEYRRQSAETEEAQLNDFLQEVRQQTALSTEADPKKKPHQQQPPQRRRKVHLGSDVSDVSVTSSSSGGARAAAASRFLKSSSKPTAASAPQRAAPQPQPSAAPPKRSTVQQQQQQQQQSAGGRHSAVLDRASRLTAQRTKQTQPPPQSALSPAGVSTSLSSSLTDPDRPKSRKARLLPTQAEAREADDETRHQLYRHRASLDYLTESESHSIGRDGARFLRRTTDAAPQRQTTQPKPSDGEAAQRQPPLTPKSPKQLRFSTEHHVRSFTADSAEYDEDDDDEDDDEEDEETHSHQADRLVIRHRPPVPPIELSQDSSIGEVVVRKPALKKSSSFSDIQGADAAGLLETSRQFESIDTDEPPTRRSDTIAGLTTGAEDDRDDSDEPDEDEAGRQNIILDFDQLSAASADEDDRSDRGADAASQAKVEEEDDVAEEVDEDVDFDRSVAEEISTAEASDRYDSDFEADAAPTYTQDFDNEDEDESRRREFSESQRRSSWDSNTSSSSTSKSTVREETRTAPTPAAREDSRSRSRSGSSERTTSRTATSASSATTTTASSSSSRSSGDRRGRRRRSRRHRSRSPSPRYSSRRHRHRDVEVQTQLDAAGRLSGDGLRYQWDPVGFGQATASRGLGLGSVDPAPIASLTVSADALEAVTAYTPASAALNSLVRDQLALTAAFLASQRRVYEGAVAALRREPGRHRYTTLEDTREFIQQNRPRSLTMAEALRLVEAE